MPTRPRIGDSSFQREIARITPAIRAEQPTPMRHEAWLRACAEAIAPDDAYEIISIGEERKLRAAAFFRQKRGLVFRRLALLGADDIPLHTDVFFEDKQSANELADEIVRRKLPIKFGFLLEQSTFIRALNISAKGKALIAASSAGSAPFLNIDDAFLQPEQKFNKRKQADLRRRRRKLDSKGEIEIQILAPEPDEIDALLDEFIELEASGWKGRAKTALAYDRKEQAFFRRYAQLASEAGIFRFSSLRVDGRLVAARIGAQCDGSFWGFKSGYDETFKDCSPGVILFMEVLRHAAKEKLATYEFLGVLEPWVKDWTNETRPKVKLRYYPCNIAGAAALSSDVSASLLHHARKWFSERKKKFLHRRR